MACIYMVDTLKHLLNNHEQALFLTAIRAVLQTAFFFDRDPSGLTNSFFFLFLTNLLFCQGVIFHPFSTFDILGCVRTCQDISKHVEAYYDKLGHIRASFDTLGSVFLHPESTFRQGSFSTFFHIPIYVSLSMTY